MKRLDIATLGLVLFALPGWAQDFDAVVAGFYQRRHSAGPQRFDQCRRPPVGVHVDSHGVFLSRFRGPSWRRADKSY